MMPVQPADFTNEELRQAVIEQHRDCPTCHPGLPPRGRDYVRVGAWLGVLSLSLVAWIVGITWLATR